MTHDSKKGDCTMNEAVICTICGERKTKDSSGICASCRRRADRPLRLCSCCQIRNTRNQSGICYVCSHAEPSQSDRTADGSEQNSF